MIRKNKVQVFMHSNTHGSSHFILNYTCSINKNMEYVTAGKRTKFPKKDPDYEYGEYDLLNMLM